MLVDMPRRNLAAASCGSPCPGDTGAGGKVAGLPGVSHGLGAASKVPGVGGLLGKKKPLKPTETNDKRCEQRGLTTCGALG